MRGLVRLTRTHRHTYLYIIGLFLKQRRFITKLQNPTYKYYIFSLSSHFSHSRLPSRLPSPSSKPLEMRELLLVTSLSWVTVGDCTVGHRELVTPWRVFEFNGPWPRPWAIQICPLISKYLCTCLYDPWLRPLLVGLLFNLFDLYSVMQYWMGLRTDCGPIRPCIRMGPRSGGMPMFGA